MPGRDGFSSEDLLRQAREAIARRDVTGDPPAEPPPAEPPRDRADTFTPAPVEQAVPPFRALPEDPPPAAHDVRPSRPADGMVRPTDRIATGSPAPATGRPAIIIGILVAVFGVGAAIFVAGLVDDATTVDAARAGTCLNDPGGEVVTDIDPISCDRPHEYEMIGSVKIPGEAYPGDEASFDLAIERCVPLFEEYVGIAYEDSVWWLNAFTPTEEGWQRGDRVANCLVFQFDADRNVLAVTGSARGTAR
jgi:hypothetical protein